MAIKLFSRSIACGDDLPAIQAGYRLGLIQIWSGNMAEAEKVLKTVSETNVTTDFRQRALYWRYYANKQLKNLSLARELQARLLREYPLSLHALLAGDGLGKVESKILNPADPAVAFRSIRRSPQTTPSSWPSYYRSAAMSRVQPMYSPVMPMSSRRQRAGSALRDRALDAFR